VKAAAVLLRSARREAIQRETFKEKRLKPFVEDTATLLRFAGQNAAPIK
jgi:hypothetical protein